MARAAWILTIAIAIGVAAVVWMRRPGDDPAPALAAPPATETDPVAVPQAILGEPEISGPTGERVAEVIEHPRLAKLVDRELSSVPHEVVGASDDKPESDDLGNIRSFVLVVDPSLDDADLEDLLRDTLARHREAEFLIVRVFDSHEAAVRPRWVDRGAAASEHQVAELRRSPYYEADKIRVRGRDIAP